MIAAIALMLTLGPAPRVRVALQASTPPTHLITLVDTSQSARDPFSGFIFGCIAASNPQSAIHPIGITEAEHNRFRFPFADRNILVLHVPTEQEWQKGQDTYVPKLDDLLGRMAVAAPKNETYVIIPPYRVDQDKAWYEDVFIPLTKQAIRESHVREIVASDSETTLRVQIESTFADWKTITHGWKVVGCDSFQKDEGEPEHAIDGDPSTYWHTEYDPKTTKYPHFIEVDTGSVKSFNGFRYLPRQDGGTNGDVGLFNLEVSSDGETWTTVLDNQKVSGGQEAVFAFSAPVSARYYKFTALQEQEKGPWTAAAELELIP